ncbi:MAG: cytochrome c biogenesis protein CcsA [Planctomycetota bacterium]
MTVIHRLAILLTFAFCAYSWSQTAPAGNAHPESQEVTEGTEELPPPFGEPRILNVSPEDKYAFALQVDVSPLRKLAVFHNGRVKILDTLARETVSSITGSETYSEPAAFLDGETDATYDPLFTLLDLVIDPQFYFNRPLMHINFLPLRQRFLDAAVDEGLIPNEDARSVWLRTGRIAPSMDHRYGAALASSLGIKPGYQESFSDLYRAVQLWNRSESNFMLIAPESTSDSWHHISEWPADSPVRVAAASLGEAWRVGDAAAANAAIAQLAELLPTINPELYPTDRADLEHLYNTSNAFEWATWLYLTSTVALLIALGTGRRWVNQIGIGLFVISVGVHAFGFTLRCIIAERFAIQNQYESMMGLSLFLSLVGGGMMVARRQLLFGAAAAAGGFLVAIAATQTGIPGKSIEREAAILNTSVLLKYHVTTVLTSYGLITLGFVIALFYLAAHYIAKLSGNAPSTVAAALHASPEQGHVAKPKTARTLADLDSAQMIVLQLAFWTLGVGIMLGAWWADHSWGRWWAFDPKETWALITWIVYLIVIHVRHTTGGKKGLITAWLSVVGFFIMLFTYFGVNLLLPGLHAYA